MLKVGKKRDKGSSSTHIFAKEKCKLTKERKGCPRNLGKTLFVNAMYLRKAEDKSFK